MAFEARHLRVTLPCGTETKIVGPNQPEWAHDYLACEGGGSRPLCEIDTHLYCIWGATRPPGMLTVAGDELPALKANLEARLRDIEEAQRRLEEEVNKP